MKTRDCPYYDQGDPELCKGCRYYYYELEDDIGYINTCQCDGDIPIEEDEENDI